MKTHLQDITIETIDYNWIKQTTKISHLKRAIRLIDHDGNYYTELKDACYERMQQIDPQMKRLAVQNTISEEQKIQIDKELIQWEKSQEKKSNQKKVLESNLEDYESYFEKDNKPKDMVKKTERAERQRLKGNQAIKSKDYEEAITYYSNSIDYDSTMYMSYGNRALAYLKKKQFHKCINDCEAALRINSIYTKAIHRKAKALVGLSTNPIKKKKKYKPTAA